MTIPKPKVFGEANLMPSIDVIPVKTDCPEDVNLVSEKIIYIYPCLYKNTREMNKKENKVQPVWLTG